ncbi:hypothetical protein [Occallatibacter savannae]|uniref:hypothetical protein n=1 Tax=Occallatibacter savannae TaxID=1002691 RepID=UPI000D688911|nr:hypothetical protein [Occallatibacter savannae]
MTAGDLASFRSEREAKEYLISRIVAEARVQGTELSDVERKMLYFTETGWTLPGIMDVNAEFERDHDNEEYESKIAGIVRQVEKANSATGGDQQSLWDDAVVKLSEGDHYLLVLIGLGRSAPAGKLSKWLPVANFYGTARARPVGDFFRLIAVAVASILLILAVVVIQAWLRR